ncbi:MAG: hydrogenase small subunit [Planctomycetota bacterium]|jgi:hydrogenase small subunit
MEVKDYPVIWLQGAACTGCSISILNSASPRIQNLLLDQVVPGHQINMKFHPNVMAGQGEPALEVIMNTGKAEKGKYIFIVEGAIPTEADGLYAWTGEENDKPVTILDRVIELGKDALMVLAVGTCAAFGGIPSGSPNPTGCKGVKEIFEAHGINTPLVNIPGCAPHPDWIVGTIAAVIFSGLSNLKVDDVGRPKLFFGELIHENCPRRPYFDKAKFASKSGEEGCLYMIGCKGPYTYADCPIRQWNNGANWCIKAGSPCIGCVQPEFPDNTSPFYEKITYEDLKCEK